MPYSAKILLLMGIFAISACAASSEALPTATATTTPGSSGYVIIGLSEQNAIWKLGEATVSMALGLQREGGGAVVMARAGCGSVEGFWGNRPCDLKNAGWQVLKVDPGEWRPRIIVEKTHVPLAYKTLRDEVPETHYVHVGPGEVVYLGDYVFAVDYDAQQIAMVRHDRNDLAAEQALSTYPGLRTQPIIYRDPMAKPSPTAMR